MSCFSQSLASEGFTCRTISEALQRAQNLASSY
jgi:hypothetical protein